MLVSHTSTLAQVAALELAWVAKLVLAQVAALVLAQVVGLVPELKVAWVSSQGIGTKSAYLLMANTLVATMVTIAKATLQVTKATSVD